VEFLPSGVVGGLVLPTNQQFNEFLVIMRSRMVVQYLHRFKPEDTMRVQGRELGDNIRGRSQLWLQLRNVEYWVDSGLPGQIQLVSYLTHLPDDGERAIKMGCKL
jgi:hypothetical protein